MMIFEAQSTSSTSKDDLLRQLRTFLSAASGTTRPPVKPALCSTALQLLVRLPAAREAVLEYFGHVLDGVVARYNSNPQQQEDRGRQEDEEMVLEELSSTLSDLVTASPGTGSPWPGLVSAWCLDCLGKLSSKWSNKICGKTTSLHEKLTAWLGCSVGRVLLHLAADCLGQLMEPGAGAADTDTCITALLETSVKHTPHFDWVLAHIGSCFPQTVTRRVLGLGLRDFMAVSREAGPGVGGEAVLARSARLTSVVNILGHLTSTHLTDVQTALHSLLLSSATTHPATPATTATLPFLLALAGVDSGLRRALTTDLAAAAAPHLARAAQLYPAWTQHHFTPGSLLAAVSNLLLLTDRGGPQLLLLLLRVGEAGEESVAAAGRVLLNTVLAELFTQVHAAPRHRQDEVPLLTGMAAEVAALHQLLLSEHAGTAASAATLVCLHAVYKGRRVSAAAVKFLLCHAATAAQLARCVQLVEQLEQFHTELVREAVAAALGDGGTDKQLLVTNLTSLCSGECDNQPASWVAAVTSVQPQLAELLARPQLTGDILQLLVAAPPGPQLRVRAVYRLGRALVSVLLDTVTSEAEAGARLGRVAAIESLLQQLARAPCGLQICLRALLDASLNTSFCAWLGGALEPGELSARQQQAVSLLEDNYKHGTKPVQPLGSTVTYHAGVIGAGTRPASPQRPVSEDQAEANRRLVAGVIQRLCDTEPGEGVKQLALMLVEMISPDIMYNGLPWPEEEFIKVTIERDLAISRCLGRHPLVWTLLQLLARARPALCYCSVLVRAVLAVLISHWSSHVTSRLSDHAHQARVTAQVLDLMAVGQFVPPQLALVPHCLHIFDPFQLHCVLIGKINQINQSIES